MLKNSWSIGICFCHMSHHWILDKPWKTAGLLEVMIYKVRNSKKRGKSLFTLAEMIKQWSLHSSQMAQQLMCNKHGAIFQMRSTIWYQRTVTDIALAFSSVFSVSSYMLLLSSLKFLTFLSVIQEKGGSLVESLILSWNGACVSHGNCWDIGTWTASSILGVSVRKNWVEKNLFLNPSSRWLLLYNDIDADIY